jgi:hypothetical protein
MKDKNHSFDHYKDRFMREIQIAGATPYKGREEKSSKSEGAPSGGIEVGHEEGGYRFKGGNPGDQSNWEKI